MCIRDSLNTERYPLSSHPEHAEVCFLLWQTAGEIKQEGHHVAGLERIDHHVTPGVAREVVGVRKILKSLANRSAISLALFVGPARAIALVDIVLDHRERVGGLIRPHDRG